MGHYHSVGDRASPLVVGKPVEQGRQHLVRPPVTTAVAVTLEVKCRLNALRGKGETVDDVLRRVLDLPARVKRR